MAMTFVIAFVAFVAGALSMLGVIIYVMFRDGGPKSTYSM